MNKAGGNWVAGDDFFDRGAELVALVERVKEGTHTLLTAQRRMGKTSLVRELLRRLDDEGAVETIFVDLEAMRTRPPHAVTEIALPSKGRTRRVVSDQATVQERRSRQETEVSGQGSRCTELRVKLRAGLSTPATGGTRATRSSRPLPPMRKQVVLALDELPILVNRLLKGDDYTITPERKRAADEFLSWLRKNGQAHRGQITMLLSGSVSLEPILQQAGLSAHANIFSPFDLKPWDEKTASECLGALAETYGLDLSKEVREAMCKRLRCQIPHHVQRFFDVLHEDLRRAGRKVASLDDVQRVYESDMLGVRGQMDMPHYEGRLRMVLGDEGCRIALDLLTEAAVAGGMLSDDALAQQRERQAEANPLPIEDVLHVLEHDGYLERYEGGYRFISGLLEDWWRTRYGRSRALAPNTGSAGGIQP